MTNEENIRDLSDQICRLDLPFDPDAILAIVRAHVAVVPSGPHIAIVVRLLEPGHARVNTVRTFANKMKINEDQVAEYVRKARALVEHPEIPMFWMSYMQNMGTIEEPSYVIALPKFAVIEMLR